jgi:glycosyltransferase involved in cell wall biosynthesis
MKVLIVCSGNTIDGKYSDFILHHSFIYEQTEELKKHNIEFEYFFIHGKGLLGYLKNYRRYLRIIRIFKPDIVHAHYGLSGFFANLQRKVPVITTFHGSDVFLFKFNRMLSLATNFLSKSSIVVNKKMKILLRNRNKIHIVPCGVDLNRSFPLKISDPPDIRGLDREKTNVLFSSRFDYYEKNYPLAKEVLALLGQVFNLIELKGYSREEVNILMNSCDVALMTSISEGSPQFIKEAMACNCPVVSTDVGDVQEVLGSTAGCYITSFNSVDIVEKVKMAVEFRRMHRQTRGRERIIELGLDLGTIAAKIIKVYNTVLDKNR